MLTFFCKRERHGDCPGEWPVGAACGPNHDCSFDMRMVKCACGCHAAGSNKKKEKREEKAAARAVPARKAHART